jgi:hypothetical protein
MLARHAQKKSPGGESRKDEGLKSEIGVGKITELGTSEAL